MWMLGDKAVQTEGTARAKALGHMRRIGVFLKTIKEVCVRGMSHGERGATESERWGGVCGL